MKTKGIIESKFQLVVRQPALFAARQSAAAEIGELSHRQIALHLLDRVDSTLKSGDIMLADYEGENSRFSRYEADKADAALARLGNYIEQLRAVVREGTEGGAS